MIEDVFKLAKNAYSMAKLHRNTMSFVKNYCSLSVLLVRITVAVGIIEKDTLQRLAEC